MRIAIITRDVSGTINEYRCKGYAINRNDHSVRFDNIIIYVLRYDDSKSYKQKLAGLLLDDIRGRYDTEDLIRLKSFRRIT